MQSAGKMNTSAVVNFNLSAFGAAYTFLLPIFVRMNWNAKALFQHESEMQCGLHYRVEPTYNVLTVNRTSGRPHQTHKASIINQLFIESPFGARAPWEFAFQCASCCDWTFAQTLNKLRSETMSKWWRKSSSQKSSVNGKSEPSEIWRDASWFFGRRPKRL